MSLRSLSLFRHHGLTLLCAGLCTLGAASRVAALTVTPPTFAELAGLAEQIVEVRVRATHCQWDTTPAGARVIHTYVDCEVADTMKGAIGAQLTLRFLGGQVGTAHLDVPDLPRLSPGDSYILFLAQNGRAFCPVVRATHGAYRIVSDPDGVRRVLRYDGTAPAAIAGSSTRGVAQVAATAPNAGPEVPAFRAAILSALAHAEGSHAR